MKRLERHVFVCVNERPEGHPRGCCAAKYSMEILRLFKEALLKRRLNLKVRAQKAGCLDTCEFGPSVVVYPEGIWDGRIKPEDVERIVESHLVSGQPVRELQMPGKSP